MFKNLIVEYKGLVNEGVWDKVKGIFNRPKTPGSQETGADVAQQVQAPEPVAANKPDPWANFPGSSPAERAHSAEVGRKARDLITRQSSPEEREPVAVPTPPAPMSRRPLPGVPSSKPRIGPGGKPVLFSTKAGTKSPVGPDLGVDAGDTSAEMIKAAHAARKAKTSNLTNLFKSGGQGEVESINVSRRIIKECLAEYGEAVEKG